MKVKLSIGHDNVILLILMNRCCCEIMIQSAIDIVIIPTQIGKKDYDFTKRNCLLDGN